MPQHSQAFFVSIPPHRNAAHPRNCAPIFTGAHPSSPLGQKLDLGILVTKVSQFIPLNVRTYYGMHAVNSLYEQHFSPPHHPLWLTGPDKTKLELEYLEDPLLKEAEDQLQNLTITPQYGMRIKPYKVANILVAHAGWIPSMFPITELTILPSVFQRAIRPGIQGLEWAETLKILVLNSTAIYDADLEIIKNIPNLEHLEIASCSMLRTIQGLHGAPNIKVLDASKIKMAPHDTYVLGSLPSLELLNVAGSIGFSSLNGLQKAKKLHYVDLSETSVTENAFMILGQLPFVDNVNFSSCKRYFNLPTKFQPTQKPFAFKRLNLSNGNVHDEIFIWIANMPALEELSFANSEHLPCKALHSLQTAHNLMQLDFSGTVIASLREVGLLPLLEFLNINGCANLKTLAGLEYASKLRKLMAINTPLQSTEPICELNALTYVDFSRSTSIQIMRLPRYVQIIHLSSFPQLSESIITALQRCEHLVDLTLDALRVFHPSFLCDLQSVKNHTMRRLSIRESSITQEDFNKIFETLFYTHLKHEGLQDIILACSRNIKKLPPFNQPFSHDLMLERISLRELEIGDDDLRLIVDLFPNLKALNISGCKNITNFTPLAQLLHLESLILLNTTITDEQLLYILNALKQSGRLKLLDLRQCSKLSCNSEGYPENAMCKFNTLQNHCTIQLNDDVILGPQLVQLSFTDAFDVSLTLTTYSIFKPHTAPHKTNLKPTYITPISHSVT